MRDCCSSWMLLVFEVIILLQWIRCFLTSRLQRVVINGQKIFFMVSNLIRGLFLALYYLSCMLMIFTLLYSPSQSCMAYLLMICHYIYSYKDVSTVLVLADCTYALLQQDLDHITNSRRPRIHDICEAWKKVCKI